MLACSDVDRLSKQFYAYDHDWRFYWSFLGEPFLIGDLLVYFDGTILYIAAFPLDDPKRVVREREVADIASLSQFRACRCVDVWGRFEAPDAIVVGSTVLERFDESGYDANPIASVIDVSGFDLGDHREARKAVNRARNKRYSSRASNADGLTARQIVLIEEWRRDHDLGPIAVSIAAAIPAYVRWNNVETIEATLGDDVVGFGLVSFVAPHAAVLSQSFLLKSPGGVAGDVVFHGAISLCKQRGVRELHVGYSSTDSLIRFKKKWGALPRARFREAFYAVDDQIEDLVSRQRFLWQRRLVDAPS